MPTWDVIVVGGGAAGLMAAANASQHGGRVLLLEKNRKLGVKILMSGGTRCNITHNCGVREIVSAFGRPGKFLHSALAALPPSSVIEKIEGQGVATKIESTGKIFPVSNKAIDVRDALVRIASAAGAQLHSAEPVSTIDTQDGYFLIETSVASYRTKSLIITTGGKSYPGCGTTGDGYRWAEQFGHTIVPTVPALVPILNDCQWANQLKGVTVEQAAVEVWQPDQPLDPVVELTASQRKKRRAQSLAKTSGSFLFTHWGFSGPSVLDVSRQVSAHDNRKSLQLVCDFFPAQTLPQFEDFLTSRKSGDGKQMAGNLLADLFPKRMAESLLKSADIEPRTRNAELSKKQLAAIAREVKQCRFQINGTLGFEKAEVTAGGISLKEIDSKTMASKCCPGLFFAGEVLDLDGPIGGYNFQAAFSTGWLAGQWASINSRPESRN